MEHPEITQLFKYREFNDSAIDCLVKDKIWVPSAWALNDPFETYHGYEQDLTLETMQKMYANASEENLPGLIDYLIEEDRKNEFRYGIFCLSASNRIGLMWSLYSDGYKGFCIGYERSENNVLGSSNKCKDVDYTDCYPSIRLSQLIGPKSSNDEEFYRKCILTKDINWKYEQEWRLLCEEKNQLMKLEAPLQSITFGMRMPEIQRKDIRRILADKIHIEYYQADPSRNSYDVDIVRLD